MYVDIDSRGLLTINEIHPEDAQRISQIIRQAEKNLLNGPIIILAEQLNLQLKESVLPIPNKKP